MADGDAVDVAPEAPEVVALRSSAAPVRRAALEALRERPALWALPELRERLRALVADSASEVRQVAVDLVASLNLEAAPVEVEVASVLSEERKEALRCGKTWKCLCVEGFGLDLSAHNHSNLDPAPAAPAPPASPKPRFQRPKSSKPKLSLETYLEVEPPQHWVVRDALAFTPKALQGDVLVQLLRQNLHERSLRESALLALRRLVPVYWARHASHVAETLEDKAPEIRMAALIALFHLDSMDLELQAPRVVARLRDELWPVREAALATLRKLKPAQLRRWSHQVLRCKLDWHLRVRCAAQRVLERLDPSVLADLACKGARGTERTERTEEAREALSSRRFSSET